MTLMQRRRAIMGAAKGFLRIITSGFYNGLGGNLGRPNSTPPYTSGDARRCLYPTFDILFDGGKTYRFTADCTYSTAQMGIQFFNQNGLDSVSDSTAISVADNYDPGWKSLDVSIAVPATANNSPIRGARFTFRQSTANPTLSADFAITKLTIKEVTT